MEDEELLTIAQAVERTGLSENALRTAIFRGTLPHTDLYGRKLLKPADVDHYKATAKKGRPKKGETEQ